MGQFLALTFGLCTPPSGGCTKKRGGHGPLRAGESKKFELGFVVGSELPDAHGTGTVQRHATGGGCDRRALKSALMQNQKLPGISPCDRASARR